jgi:hypothetical protein
MSAFGGKADIDRILQNSESAAADIGATTVNDNGISEQKVTEHLFPMSHSSMPFMVAADATNLQR